MSQIFILPEDAAGLQEEAGRRAKAFHQVLSVRYSEYGTVSLVALAETYAYLLRDLGLQDSFDWALRLLVARLFPRDWGDVEGVTAHMSSRGYCELHVWTTGQHGRCVEVSVGNSFTGSKIPDFRAYTDRCRTHGAPTLSVHVPTRDGSAAAQFVLDALRETEPGPLERLAQTHEEEK